MLRRQIILRLLALLGVVGLFVFALLTTRLGDEPHIYEPAPYVPDIPALEETEKPEEPEYVPRVPNPFFLGLREEYANEDIMGHILIPGTTVDYLVVQAGDNEFYLYHDIHGRASNAGWVFLDYMNCVYILNRNTILYGHNMRAGHIFGSLPHFRNADFFAENRYIIFNTLYDNMTWEIFAFYTTHISFPYIAVDYHFDSEQWPWLTFEWLLDGIADRNWFETDIKITPDCFILTLSTCTDFNRDYRYVLHARLITELDAP